MGAVPLAEFWMLPLIPVSVYSAMPGLRVWGAAAAGALVVSLLHGLPEFSPAPRRDRKFAQDPDQFAVRWVGAFAIGLVALLPAISRQPDGGLFHGVWFDILIAWIRSLSTWSAVLAHGIVWNSWIGARFRLSLLDAHGGDGQRPPFGSHPVPDRPEIRRRLTRARGEMALARTPVAPPAEAAVPSLASDRINYLVGEAPSYQIRNAPPDQPIQWIIARDGQPPVPYSDPAQRTDGSGSWSGPGGVWTVELTGFYTITTQVGDWSASTCFTVIDGFPPAPGKSTAELVGITHVAGDYRFAGPGTPFGDAPFLVEGAQHILNLGGRRGFFYLTPQYQTSDYRFDDFGAGPIDNLTDLAKSPPFRKLFEQPFDQFVFTTYTFGNWEWILDRAQGGQSVPFAANAETAEIAELVAYLAEEYPDKEFILKNWEGDWQLQGNYDINGIPTPERIDEFIEWMHARQAGVVQGRQRAGVAGSIQHAIEFNALSKSVRDRPGVLRDVVRQVESDLVSYSSWETSGRFDTRRMKDAIVFIERAPAVEGRKVMIAEFGVPNSPADANDEAHADALLQAFLEMGVNAFFWQIFNNGVPVGLIGPDFQHSNAWFALRQALGGRNEAAVVRDPALTEVPEAMNPGQTATLSVTFRNTGEPWYQSVGYELELVGPGDAVLGERAWLPHDVPGRGQATFTFDFTAPAEPGSYRFQMAQHGIELFGEPVSFEVRE